MRKILVVEDSQMVIKVLKRMFAGGSLFQPVYAESFAEAKSLLDEESEGVFAALVDLNLPDAPNGEVVDFTLSRHIPTVVLTGSFDEEKRTSLLSKGIVDYVTKEGRYSYKYTVGVLERLVKNQSIKVLVVEDSETARRFVCSLLRLHLYQVVEAADGVQAIKVLLDNPDIRLLITDYNMPRMNGCELIKNIRVTYEKSDLVIIGLSSEGETSLSARFIKAGANDFLRKPFNHEEFYCRVTQNVEVLELIESIRDAGRRDHLTRAYNLHYFHEVGDKVIGDARDSNTAVSVAVFELDGFDNFVQQWGLEISELVLKLATQELLPLFGNFVFARAEAQRFLVLMPGLCNEKAVAYVEKVRQIFCTKDIAFCGHTIRLTFSAGVSSLQIRSFEELVKYAVVCLRRARDAGGDLVFGDDY